MEQYLNKGIKEVIEDFPEIGRILQDYEIGCVPCMVGTCLLKDVVQIHNLSKEDEKDLFKKISEVIYPGKDIEIPLIEREEPVEEKDKGYSPPIRRLVEEHYLIKRLLSLIPEIAGSLDLKEPKNRDAVLAIVDFIKDYADKYHHAKEEEILFKYFDESSNIIGIMLEDHKTARGYVKTILEALEEKNTDKASHALLLYHDLLSEHIKREDEILYRWIDRNISDSAIGELYSRFDEADKAYIDVPGKYSMFINELERLFDKQGGKK